MEVSPAIDDDERQRGESTVFVEVPTAQVRRIITAAQLKKLSRTQGYHSINYETGRFSGITTFHGFFRIYEAKGWRKLFWTMVILIALFIFGIQVQRLWTILASKPVSSKIEYVISRGGLDFPSVTVCNYNPIRKDYVEHLATNSNFSNDLLTYIMMHYWDLGVFLDQENSSIFRNELHEMEAKYNNYTQRQSNFTLRGFFSHGGNECNDMLRACFYSGRQIDCCEHFVAVQTDLGICYQFNPDRIINSKMTKQFLAGPQHGLEFIGMYDEMQETELPFGIYERGLRVYVHEKRTPPYLSGAGVSVNPNMRLYAAVTASHYDLLPVDQWGSCNPAWPSHYNSTAAYSAAACEAKCLSTKFHKACGCAPLRYSIDDAFPICTPMQIYNCLTESMTEMATMEAVSQSCPDCLVECDRWEYTEQTSYSNKLYRYWEQMNKQNKTAIPEDEFMRKMLVVNVFLTKMAYINVEQSKATGFTETLSDIGGNMGLFLGASVVTVAELLVFLLKLLWACISKQRRHRLTTKKSEQSNPVSPGRSPVDLDSPPNGNGKLARDASNSFAFPISALHAD